MGKIVGSTSTACHNGHDRDESKVREHECDGSLPVLVFRRT